MATLRFRAYRYLPRPGVPDRERLGMLDHSQNVVRIPMDGETNHIRTEARQLHLQARRDLLGAPPFTGRASSDPKPYRPHNGDRFGRQSFPAWQKAGEVAQVYDANSFWIGISCIRQRGCEGLGMTMADYQN